MRVITRSIQGGLALFPSPGSRRIEVGGFGSCNGYQTPTRIRSIWRRFIHRMRSSNLCDMTIPAPVPHTARVAGSSVYDRNSSKP
jgi:hypothetical protein